MTKTIDFTDGLFKSANDAVVFAVNYASQQYSMSAFGRAMGRRTSGSGKGLFGLDGAAQAGMIKAEVARLPRAEGFALIARCADQRVRCECRSPCCSGWRTSEPWEEAVRFLTEHVVQSSSGMLSHYRMRRAAVEKHFGAKVRLADIAEDCEVSVKTAGTHVQHVRKTLRTLEHSGWEKLDLVLWEKGVLIRENENVATS